MKFYINNPTTRRHGNPMEQTDGTLVQRHNYTSVTEYTFTEARAERITKIVKFFPHNGSILKRAPNEEAIAAARDLIEALKTKHNNKKNCEQQ